MRCCFLHLLLSLIFFLNYIPAKAQKDSAYKTVVKKYLDYQPYQDSATGLAISLMNDTNLVQDTLRAQGNNRFFFRCHRVPVITDSIVYIITSGNWLIPDAELNKKKPKDQKYYFFEKKIFVCGDDRCRKKLEDILEKMFSDLKKAGAKVTETQSIDFPDNNALILKSFVIDKKRGRETSDMTVYLHKWKYRDLHSLYISCKVPLNR